MKDYSYRFFKRRYQHFPTEKQNKIRTILIEMDHSNGYDLDDIEISSTLFNLFPEYSILDFILLLTMYEIFFPKQEERDDKKNMEKFKKGFVTNNSIPWGLIITKCYLDKPLTKIPKQKKSEFSLTYAEQIKLSHERKKIEKDNKNLEDFKKDVRRVQRYIDPAFRSMYTRNSHGSSYLKQLLYFLDITPREFIMHSNYFIQRKKDLYWLYSSLDETNKIIIHRLMDIL